ncbi:MAG: type II toxin-antitoxin system RelE/ParE family toxin [Bifidobacteriaceae bacterium]|jgi:hypothetical protein|nr:type II toxin-antitoxin system RelE/ParE family toxin [Bifidobacteriaceae bacterium]
MVQWTVEAAPEVADWLCQLDTATYEHVVAALKLLEQEGPALGRPLVDTVKGSKFNNMKELRPPTPGKQTIRILFAFDPVRQAFLLVAGDKTNQWAKWYKKAIPIADGRYERHLADLRAAGPPGRR